MKATPNPGVSDLAQQVLHAAQRDGLGEHLLRTPMVLGVSGGADSLAMLHLLHTLRGADSHESLHVAHLDHGFRGEQGADDALFVRRVAEVLGLPFTMMRFDVPAYARAHKLSPEDAARRVRYAFLSKLARERSALVGVAHTADDQAETVLMNILRGSGVTGLAGMRPLAEVPLPRRNTALPFAESPGDGASVILFRPLLSVRRTEVEQYCALNGLQPRFDESNSDTTYTRNRLRHELIPLLAATYSPSITRHLYNLSRLASDEDALMEQLVDEQWASVCVESWSGAVSFEPGGLARLPVALQRRMVRRGISLLLGGLEGFSFEHVQVALDMLPAVAPGRGAIDLPRGVTVSMQDGSLVLALKGQGRRDDREHLAARWPLISAGMEGRVRPGETLALKHGWELRCTLEEATGELAVAGQCVALCDAEQLPHDGLVVRRRMPGDWIRPLGMTGRKRLQDLYADAKIPGEVRGSLAVIALQRESGEVLWVPGPGGRRSGDAIVTRLTRKMLRLEFTRNVDQQGGSGARP